jgi:hypothetical protein
MNTDTPLPQEEPAGQNPPDGAIINYYNDQKATNISLEIIDAKGMVVTKYTNQDSLYKIPDNNVPSYWLRPQQILSGEAGSHRFIWDMHYQPLNISPSFPIAAIYENTAPNETSPWVMPGKYTAKLIVDGKVCVTSFIVKMDPRVKTSKKDLQLQHDLSLMCYNSIKKCMAATKAGVSGLDKLQNTFAAIQNALQESDMPVTTQMIMAAKKAADDLKKAVTTMNK